ncbi:MAG: DUF885 domain-containing protein [Eubacteriales bacterium]|nr:DUF885 domain-containing protein [Eubacteriales bacterium]
MNLNTRKYRLFFPLFLFLLLSLAGCQKQKTSSDDASFRAFTKQCWEEFVSADAISLHFKLSDPSSYGISEQSSPSYGDFSFEKQQKECIRARELLSELQDFSPQRLSPENQRTYAIFQKALENISSSEDYILHQSLLGTNGVPSQIPVTLSEYYFTNEKDVKTYLSLVNQIPALFEQLLSFEEKRRSAGFISPDFVISNTIAQVEDFLKYSEDKNLLVETFEEKIEQLPSLSKDQKTTYIQNNRALVRQVVLPAFRSLQTSLKKWENSYPEKERLCQYDGGQEYYQWLLSSKTGTSLTPDECIDILESQLQASIQSLSSLSEEHPDIYTDYLASSPLLKDADAILSELEADAFIDFPEIPEVSYTLKEVPHALSSSSASAFYFLPPIDVKNQNVIYLNSSRIDRQELFSTLAHEGYPGHLYQTNYFLNTDADPLRYLLSCDGWEEGWGTYAQIYSYQYMDFEETDRETTLLLQQMYKENDLISLALSSLSDLYVNYKNYTPEKLAQYLGTYGVEPSAIQNIYEYVIENPTTYLSYSIGYYELEKLKTEVADEMGDDFDIQEFHQAVLDVGSCPFSLLKEQVSSLLVS